MRAATPSAGLMALLSPTILCAACVILGVLVRLWGFASNGSLWLDELFIAQNLRERTFAGLLEPLADGQNAPIAWLMLHKAIDGAFGGSDAALRVPSLVSSVLALPLAWWVSVRTVGREQAVLPVFVLAFGPFVIWQGLQLKPYSFDLFVALCLIALAHRPVLHGRGFLALAVCGFAAIWLSMPSVFTLAGIGAVLVVMVLRDGGRPLLAPTLALAGLWTAGALLNVIVFLHPHEQPEWLYQYWTHGFMPRSEGVLGIALWLVEIGTSALENPVGFLGVGALAAIPVAIGAGSLLLRDPGERRARLWLAVTPLATTLGGAIVAVYPFSTRLILFTVPPLLLLFTVGIAAIGARSGPWRPIVRAAVGAVMAVPLGLTLIWLPHGGLPTATDGRALVATLAAERRAAEVVVVEGIASFAWSWYGGADDVLTTSKAFSTSRRKSAISEALDALDQDIDVVWMVSARAWRPGSLTLLESLRHDLGRFDPRLATTYGWLLRRVTDWSSLDELERALPERWELYREILVTGGSLWQLRRRQPSGIEAQ